VDENYKKMKYFREITESWNCK